MHGGLTTMLGTALCMHTYYVGTYNSTMVRYYCYHSHFTKKGVSGSGRLNNEFKFSQLVSDSLAQTQVYMAPKPKPPTTHYITQLYKISEENSKALIYFTADKSICYNPDLFEFKFS